LPFKLAAKPALYPVSKPLKTRRIRQ